MVKIIGIVIAVFIFLVYVIPYLRIKKEENYLKKIINNMDEKRFKIIKNLNMKNVVNRSNQEFNIDYVIVSIYGVFLIKKIVFPKYFAMLKGNVSKNTWNYRAFFRFSNTQNMLPEKHVHWDTHNFNIPNPILELEKITDIITKDKTFKEKIKPVLLLLPKIKNVTIRGIDDVKAEALYPSLFYKKIKKCDEIIMSKEDVENIYNQLLTYKQKESTSL